MHGLDTSASIVEHVNGSERPTWPTTEGLALVEQYIIPGMGHGTPIKGSGSDACGAAAPYMPDVGLSSTRKLAAFWNIATERLAFQKSDLASPEGALGKIAITNPQACHLQGRRIGSGIAAEMGVGRVIEDALRAAGLMK